MLCIAEGLSDGDYFFFSLGSMAVHLPLSRRFLSMGIPGKLLPVQDFLTLGIRVSSERILRVVPKGIL